MPVLNPKGAHSASGRSLRGGSWQDGSNKWYRISNRWSQGAAFYGLNVTVLDEIVGIRCAKDN